MEIFLGGASQILDASRCILFWLATRLEIGGTMGVLEVFRLPLSLSGGLRWVGGHPAISPRRPRRISSIIVLA